jgi:hypothetical protein
MSINVLNHKHAVKTKVVICASLVLVVVLSLAEAGPRAGAQVRVFPPVICRTWPVFYYPAYSSWATSPVVSSTSFGNVSPAFDYGEPGIYRVPAPVIPAPPIIDSPGSTFSWRH